MFTNPPITRLALLIGAPGQDTKSKSYLPGVEEDLKRYRKYLTSPLGGSWKEEEIVTCRNPQMDSLLNYISKTKVDYTFTMFSGHGEMKQNDNCTWIWINDKEKINECDLITKSKRQISIIDSCRKVIIPSGLGDLFEKSVKAYKEVESTREIFDNHVMECEEGLITLYAAGENQAAGENSNGSFFQQALVNVALDWSNTIPLSSSQRFQTYDQYFKKNNILDFKDSFNKVLNEIRKYPTIQTPRICDGRRLKWFPFAVKS